MDQLLKFLAETRNEQEAHYINCGPNKHEQESHYTQGTAVVGMNVEMLAEYLENQDDQPELSETWNDLSPEDKRRAWETSDFHYGIFGYDQEEADFWWKKNGDRI